MPDKITPSLESITVRGKYAISQTDFNNIRKKIEASSVLFCDWGVYSESEGSVVYVRVGKELLLPGKTQKQAMTEVAKVITACRSGIPFYLSVIAVEYLHNSILLEVECRPAMWYKIANLRKEEFTENEVQEALLECKNLVKQVMSPLRGKEVEPISVYPIIQRTEIISRLLNLELKEVVKQLNKAEEHIAQNNFTESLKCSRTGFEKMVDWQMKKRGLELTNNYRNNLERLRSKGYLDKETAEFFESYYKCLSTIAVHERGQVEPGFYEAQMGYGITLIVLDYFANKLP